MALTGANLDAMRVHTETWAEQFKEAMSVKGGDIEHAQFWDYVLHFFSFFWKVRLKFLIISFANVIINLIYIIIVGHSCRNFCCIHIIKLPKKKVNDDDISNLYIYLQVLFAFIPPVAIFEGWLCFFVSLCMIGIMTIIIGDLATIFGCLIDLDDTITGKQRNLHAIS